MKVWEKMGKDRRADFIRSVKDRQKSLSPYELTGLMAQFISNELPSMLTTFAGLWMDSPDLKSKYKNKPEQWQPPAQHSLQADMSKMQQQLDVCVAAKIGSTAPAARCRTTMFARGRIRPPPPPTGPESVAEQPRPPTEPAPVSESESPVVVNGDAPAGTNPVIN